MSKKRNTPHLSRSAAVGQGQGKAPTHRVESRGSAFGFTMTRKGATLCISLSINSAALRSLMLLDCVPSCAEKPNITSSRDSVISQRIAR